jgi:hypothetical protein
MNSFRDIRVIPVVLIAIFGLAVLKVAGLVIDGGYVFDYQPQSTRLSWAAETFNFPSGNKGDPADITGSVAAKKEEPKPVVAAPEVAKPEGVVVYPDPNQPVSASERAILERLQSSGTRSPRPRSRHSREPAEIGGKAHRIEGRGIEGGRGAGQHRSRAENRNRRRPLQGHHHDV